jgi:antitoxin VapB
MSTKSKSLNIKNKDAYPLAARVAKMTGESMTEAVTQSLRERLQRLQRQQDDHDARVKRLLDIGADIASRLEEPYRSIDHADFLYDEETGLPK